MRRALTSIALLGLAGLQLPASAESLAPAQIAPFRISEGAITATAAGEELSVHAPGFRLEDLILEHLDPADATSHTDAVRAFIETTQGLELPDLRPGGTGGGGFPRVGPRTLVKTHDTPAADAPDLGSGLLSYPSPGGDLSGDGLDDVLVFDVSLPDRKIHLRALAGTDGKQLWQRPLEADDAVGMPVQDLSGDGIDDLLIWTFELTGETETEDCSSESYCRYQYDATYDWVIGLRSGENGKRVWATRYSGEDHYVYLHEVEETPPLTRSVHDQETYVSPNYSVFPYLSGDHDGDGLDDLILESIDVDLLSDNTDDVSADLVHQDTGNIRMHGAARAQVLRGADGNTLLTRSSEMGPGIAMLQPMDDMTGGPEPDLLWEESVLPDNTYSCLSVESVESCPDEPDVGYAVELDLIDGGTFEPAWHVVADGIVDGFSVGLPEDLTGDGVDDVLLMVLEEKELPFELRLLSGGNGGPVWTRAQRPASHYWELPVAFGHINGDRVTDVVLGSFLTVGDPMQSGFAAGFARVNGLTGATLGETVRPFGNVGEHAFTSTILYMDGLEDADGDGNDEVMAGSVIAGYDDETGTGGSSLVEARSTAVFESGASGTVILEKTAPQLFTMEAPADLDGQAGPEAVEWRYPLTQDAQYGVAVHGLSAPITIWSRALNGDEFENLWISGDHDGSAGEEFAYGRNDLEAGSWKSEVASLRGSNGTQRWQVRSSV